MHKLRKKLQVFVSSTFSDLIDERQAAVSAILKAGHIPAGMELFNAGDKSQMETIKRWIDESDIYMLILGGRYGSVEAISNISYTELEYDYASQQGKPLFAVVIKEDALNLKVMKSGLRCAEQENQKALKLFRAKVLTKMSSFFFDEKDIRLSVYESLSEFSSTPGIKGWISADDVEPTAPLHDEIKRLQSEVSRLNSENVSNEQVILNPISEGDDYRSLVLKLDKTEVKIPATVMIGGSDECITNLLSVTYGMRERLILGIDNSQKSNKIDIFIYYNVCPKLMVHGLVRSDEVPGVSYRRISMNERGLRFMSALEADINNGNLTLEKQIELKTPSENSEPGK